MLSSSSFNPCTHAGCNFCLSFVTFKVCRLQSMHPHGCNYIMPAKQGFNSCLQSMHPVWGATTRSTVSVNMHFNPCTHAGCNFRRINLRPILVFFNSYTPYGVQRWCTVVSFVCTILPSIHAPHARRNTTARRMDIGHVSYFNPCTHAGCN